ncbi:MAG: DDE-type integrase/transposase/recombinase [Rhodoferax sp.]|nr:DDE-type integrase/transposase/recombinase [Rhodoferax sp.]
MARRAGGRLPLRAAQIERLMRVQALRARPRQRGLPKDRGERHAAPMPPNILHRQFTATRQNQKWVADFTYVWTAEGWLYVAVVIDLFSRRVVGWSMSSSMTAQLVSNSAQYFPPNSVQNIPVQPPSFGCFFLCLKRKESFPVSRISQ